MLSSKTQWRIESSPFSKRTAPFEDVEHVYHPVAVAVRRAVAVGDQELEWIGQEGSIAGRSDESLRMDREERGARSQIGQRDVGGQLARASDRSEARAGHQEGVREEAHAPESRDVEVSRNAARRQECAVAGHAVDLDRPGALVRAEGASGVLACIADEELRRATTAQIAPWIPLTAARIAASPSGVGDLEQLRAHPRNEEDPVAAVPGVVSEHVGRRSAVTAGEARAGQVRTSLRRERSRGSAVTAVTRAVPSSSSSHGAVIHAEDRRPRIDPHATRASEASVALEMRSGASDAALDAGGHDHHGETVEHLDAVPAVAVDGVAVVLRLESDSADERAAVHAHPTGVVHESHAGTRAGIADRSLGVEALDHDDLLGGEIAYLESACDARVRARGLQDPEPLAVDEHGRVGARGDEQVVAVGGGIDGFLELCVRGTRLEVEDAGASQRHDDEHERDGRSDRRSQDGDRAHGRPSTSPRSGPATLGGATEGGPSVMMPRKGESVHGNRGAGPRQLSRASVRVDRHDRRG